MSRSIEQGRTELGVPRNASAGGCVAQVLHCLLQRVGGVGISERRWKREGRRGSDETAREALFLTLNASPPSLRAVCKAARSKYRRSAHRRSCRNSMIDFEFPFPPPSSPSPRTFLKLAEPSRTRITQAGGHLHVRDDETLPVEEAREVGRSKGEKGSRRYACLATGSCRREGRKTMLDG
jgi:hypothetical protein